MDKKKLIKIVGLLATVIGMGASLATDWANAKKLDETVAEKVAKALAEQAGKES